MSVLRYQVNYVENNTKKNCQLMLFIFHHLVLTDYFMFSEIDFFSPLNAAYCILDGVSRYHELD